MAKLRNPAASAWLIDAAVQNETASSMPSAGRGGSNKRPHKGLLIMYAIENAETMNPYCSAERCVSFIMVGMSSARVLRSM